MRVPPPEDNSTPPPTITAIRQVYASPWWTVEEHDVIGANGTKGMFNVLHCKDGVSILALDDDRILLIREYKHALGSSMLQLPSGSVDDGETPLESAQRELFEEAGLTAGDWTALGVMHPYPTNVADAVHLFVARDVRLAGPSEPGLEVLRVTVPEIHTLIDTNRITHAASLVCLLRHLRPQAC